MYFALMGKLSARRKNLANNIKDEKGFTLIELLVVVIIIGILAAIAIPVYLNVQNNAKNSATQSDVSNLKVAAVTLQSSKGALPTKFAAINGSTTPPGAFPTADDWTGSGATVGQNTTALSYGPSGTSGDFCIIGISKGGKTFYATSASGVTETACTIS